MNLVASFVACCVSGLSQRTVPCQPKICFCCVSCSSRPSAPSRKPLPTVFDRVCFGSCVQEKPSAFHATFLCRNSTDVRKRGPMRSQIFTLNTSRIKCSRSSALSSGMLTMKSSPQCTPSASSVAPLIVESFLHVRSKHLTCVTSSVETLEQSPELLLPAKVLRWHHVDHLAHFPREERHRNVKHSDDHRRVCSLGLATHCPTQN